MYLTTPTINYNITDYSIYDTDATKSWNNLMLDELNNHGVVYCNITAPPRIESLAFAHLFYGVKYFSAYFIKKDKKTIMTIISVDGKSLPKKYQLSIFVDSEHFNTDSKVINFIVKDVSSNGVKVYSEQIVSYYKSLELYSNTITFTSTKNERFWKPEDGTIPTKIPHIPNGPSREKEAGFWYGLPNNLIKLCEEVNKNILLKK